MRFREQTSVSGYGKRQSLTCFRSLYEIPNLRSWHLTLRECLKVSVLFMRFEKIHNKQSKAWKIQSFRSLYEIHDTKIRWNLQFVQDEFPFSLWDSKILDRGRNRDEHKRRFRSLYEIHMVVLTSRGGGFEHMFPFSLWDSLFEWEYEEWQNWDVSVLFMRFMELSEFALEKYNEILFPFSLWDSAIGMHERAKDLRKFPFSLWDSSNFDVQWFGYVRVSVLFMRFQRTIMERRRKI